MSIIKMNKVTIIGTKNKEEEILKEIMKKGFVQIDDSSYIAQDEELGKSFSKIDNNEELVLINKKKMQVEKAIENINKTNKIKKKMFSSKPDYIEYSVEEAEELYNLANQINEAATNINSLLEEKHDLEELKEELLPWKNLDISADLTSINYIKMIFGKLPKKYKIEQIELSLGKSINNFSVNIVNEDKQYFYVSITTDIQSYDTVIRVLRKSEFIEKNIIDKEKTVLEQIKDIHAKISDIDTKIEKNKEIIKAEYLSKLENLYDYYEIQSELKKAERNIVVTDNVFYLEGWLPSGCKIKNNKEYIIKYREPDENENTPVYIKNNKLVSPFESITNMYSYPNKNEIDPNPIMSIFFIIFFGMMLSDAGYGIILTLFAAFIVKKAGYKKSEGSLMKLLIPCGISTIFWGILFGSFFGDLIKIKPVINPLVDVMQLMGLALLFGIIHIYIGMFLKALSLIKEKKIFSAIFDVGFWYITLTGTFLLIIPIVAGDIGIWSKVGKYLALSGMVGLVLTQGRNKKGIIGKIIGGFGSLYDITSYFADVLSYSRLMALCLSTGVIAQVGNLLAKMVNPFVGIIIALIVHGINIANSALGSYVHTSRLQYVEFFGKFYEGGGTEFKPLKCKNKYTNFKEEF